MITLRIVLTVVWVINAVHWYRAHPTDEASVRALILAGVGLILYAVIALTVRLIRRLPLFGRHR